MSSQNERGLAATPSADQSVADYLAEHPDFFERHAGLLEQLRVPHRAGRAAVSLVERQVSVLQDKNRALERRLHDLVEVARFNSTLSDKIHALALRLLRADETTGVLAALEAVTGFETWRRLRQDQLLTPESAETVMLFMAHRLAGR